VLTGNLAKVNAVESAEVIHEMSRVTQSLVELEQAVVDPLQVGENQLTALMKVGRAINSSAPETSEVFNKSVLRRGEALRLRWRGSQD